MKFEQALTKMVNGQKVKLPEWVGYWFIPDDYAFDTDLTTEDIKEAVHVYTKDGDVLTTPHFDKYEAREDWEVMPE